MENIYGHVWIIKLKMDGFYMGFRCISHTSLVDTKWHFRHESAKERS